MKIIHFSDIHLGMENYGKIDAKTGLNSRLSDFLTCFDKIVKFALENKVDLVLFAGDAYKTRDPSPTYQRAFAQRISKLSKAQIPVLMITGNHDLPNALGKANTLDIFKALDVPEVYLSKKPEILEIPARQTGGNNLQIATFPWISKQQLLDTTGKEKKRDAVEKEIQNKIEEILKYLISKIDKNHSSIFLAHGTVEGAVYGSERSIMLGNDLVLPLSILKKSPFLYLGFGHIHKFQVISEKPLILYSGSIERIDFGEEKEDKGFVYFEIEDNKLKNWKFIKLPARKFISFKIKILDSDTDPTSTVVQEVSKKDIENAVVKVQISCSKEKSPQIREEKIRDVLKNAYLVASISKEVKEEERRTTLEYADTVDNLTPIDWLKKYLKNKKKSPKKIEKLVQIAQELIEEV